MYIGRIVSVANTTDGRLCGLYRVSSRSFPNRRAVASSEKVSIVPKEGCEDDVRRNPYIAYNCVRIICDGQVAVVSNGSQTDPIAEKIVLGVPIRDAIASSLLALDYEKDQYNTPRIVAAVDRRDENAGWLGIVRDNGLEVRRVYLEPGRFWYVATYEEVHVCGESAGDFPVSTVEEGCEFILSGGVFAERTNPITAVAVMSTDDGFEVAVRDMEPS